MHKESPVKRMVEIEKKRRPEVLNLAKALSGPRMTPEQLEKINKEVEIKAAVQPIQPQPKPKTELRGILWNILHKPKLEALSLHLPKFSITEPVHLEQLPIAEDPTTVDVTYDLLQPFAKVRIYYDQVRKELLYSLIEPQLSDQERQIYEKILKALTEIVDVELSTISSSEESIRYVEGQVKKILIIYNISLKPEQYLNIMYYIYRNFAGLNEIEPMMHDPYIEDIGLDGVDIPIYVVHRRFGSIRTDISFKGLEYLRDFVVKLSERCGRYISYAEPLLDGALPSGSRVQASLAGDVTTRGPTFSIRKFIEKPLSPIDLMHFGTVNAEVLAYLWMVVEAGASILISGGTATGKTTFLNVLSLFIPREAKIISIEDTRELNLPHENWIPSVARVGFGIPSAEGKYGEVTMFDLLKESFRQNPDYVIVGEVRGNEAYVLFQGMASGHSSMGTMHAGKVEDVIHRLETPPIELSPTLIEILDIIILMAHAREKGKSARRVKEIVEIESLDPNTGVARTNKAFEWLPQTDTFEYRGSSSVMQKISKLKGISLEELEHELQRRKHVLEWLHKKGITDFRKVADMFSEYRKNPKKILKEAGVK